MNVTDLIKQKASIYRDYTADNLSQIVRIPSLSGEEEEVITRLGSMMEEAEFDDIRIDGLGNLVGRIGHGTKVVAIDAHIDTVDTGDVSQWHDDPFSGLVRDGKVFGRGTVDQKGGAAAMITGGRILKELGYGGSFSIYFTFTIMEEDCDGLCWKYLIEKENLVPDYAVITEPTNLGLYRGHRGRMEIEVHFTGVSAHGSAPERGDNAIYKGCRAGLEVEKLHQRLLTDDFLGKGSVAVTFMSSQSPSLCAIPDGCMIHLDRRLTWGETLDSAVNEVAEVVDREARVIVPAYRRPSYKGTVFVQDKYFPTWKLEEEHPLVRTGIETAEQILGTSPRVDKWVFSTNAVAICGRHQIPCIGFGPGNEVLAHAPNEHIPVDHLEKASAFYALLPYMLDRQRR